MYYQGHDCGKHKGDQKVKDKIILALGLLAFKTALCISARSAVRFDHRQRRMTSEGFVGLHANVLELPKVAKRNALQLCITIHQKYEAQPQKMKI